ncbi:hypothetical protein RM533_07495 [Croceicoccus sp. F390]|uniref:Uncharacterized protein n=1 Tax=Croceicoccus esteveae TaxID=3075597 RepID=A0ABU2ZKC8_9SPHN|nr:hypothetical protein [Croceicoccus sp. F390]MDT0576029.1 hypothetical protein [Croceicoccus sp. F390]
MQGIYSLKDQAPAYDSLRYTNATRPVVPEAVAIQLNPTPLPRTFTVLAR